MKKIQIANELLKNTTAKGLIDFISLYIQNMKTIEKGTCDNEEFIRFDNCISYLEKTEFDITNWMLWEIPIFYSHDFYNSKTKQWFDLAVWDIGEVIPRYLDSDASEQDAKTIQEAIDNYYNFQQ